MPQGNNPYIIDSGRPPYEMIPRKLLFDEITNSFESYMPNFKYCYISGAQGSGKTVFLSILINYFQNKNDWTVVELNPVGNLLEDLVQKLKEEHKLGQLFSSYKIGFNSGFVCEIEGRPPIRHAETALSIMLEKMQDNDKNLLVVIDDVACTDSIITFSSAFQMLMRRDLPIFLIMAGLFDNMKAIQNAPGVISSIDRTPITYLPELNIGLIADNYAQKLSIPKDKALQMASQTKGYSYAFQILGYLSWKHGNDPTKIQREYKEYLYNYAYNGTWNRLSDEEKKLLFETASNPDLNKESIRDKLIMNPILFRKICDLLKMKGIINDNIEGYLRFNLPLFNEYILENYYPDGIE